MIIVVYYCFGTLLSVFPSTVADFFGTKNLGINYGVVFSAYAVAGIVGPMIGGYMFKTYNNYTTAFYTGGVLAVVAFVAILMAHRPEEKVAPAARPIAEPTGARA
jgi:OFA family oxalate/formate antiporter-like MFS transporter